MNRVTAQELKERFEANKNEPLPEGLVITCICGKCDVSKVELSDADYEEMAQIINGESQTKTKPSEE